MSHPSSRSADGARQRRDGAPKFVGHSAALKSLLATIDRVARFKTNVLLLGESGTGKELTARALHERGPRRGSPFVALNCASLSKELLENELFGHERGAFTGANERKKGLFELAHGGTVFLDEIGETDVSTQAKLLRALERNEFRRVGGEAKLKVDVSVVAATNQDLLAALRSGRFRQDLYYRLKVVTLKVPPLRERREDIPALVDEFIRDFNRRHGEHIKGVSGGALELLISYDWPGNVRELRNAIESAAVLATGKELQAESFAELTATGSAAQLNPLETQLGNAAVSLAIGTTLAEAERAVILATLALHKNKAEAAKVLEIGVRTLYAKLASYRGTSRRR